MDAMSSFNVESKGGRSSTKEPVSGLAKALQLMVIVAQQEERSSKNDNTHPEYE
jgi:hypothetical protein